MNGSEKQRQRRTLLALDAVLEGATQGPASVRLTCLDFLRSCATSALSFLAMAHIRGVSWEPGACKCSPKWG